MMYNKCYKYDDDIINFIYFYITLYKTDADTTL